MKIHRISVPTPFYVGPVNVYLVEEDPLTLIDVGPRNDDSLEALKSGLARLGYRLADIRTDIIKLRSSYRVKEGKRSGGPGGKYDGTFVQDYEYVAGAGDLDQCNGRTGVTTEYLNGTYYYVITSEFPFIPRCYRGTPDESFRRHGPGPGGPRGRPPGGRPPDQ